MLRPGVARFVALGPLPPQDAADDVLDAHTEAFERIETPVTQEEATALLACFGPDDCYGLASSLVTTIASAPHPVLTKEPPPGASEWLHRIWTRSR